MSIYASLAAPDEDKHEDGCAYYVLRNECYEISGKRCDCGQPRAPIIYQGSHILPSDSDSRGGWVDIALIPSHITRDGRDDKAEDESPWPYLRFGVNGERVVLTRAHVEQIAKTLTRWLKALDAKKVAA